MALNTTKLRSAHWPNRVQSSISFGRIVRTQLEFPMCHLVIRTSHFASDFPNYSKTNSRRCFMPWRFCYMLQESSETLDFKRFFK